MLLVRLCLLAFPASFRARLGGEMLAEFGARRADTLAAHGRGAAAALTLATCRNLLVTGLAERLAALRRLPDSSPATDPERSRMHALFADLRFALRALRRRPAYALVAVLTLGTGIGAATAMFSVADGLVLRPLPYPEPDRLVRVYDTFAERGRMSAASSPAVFADWRREQRVFSALAAYVTSSITWTAGAPARSMSRAEVTAEWTDALGTAPALGRGFTREEETFGGHRVAILSHGLWQREFGGDRSIIGRTVSLEGEPWTVVGVMPRGFAFPTSQTELWTPLAYDFDVSTSRGVHYITAFGRVRPDVTLDAASAEMHALNERLALEYPEQMRGWGVRLVSLHESIVGNVRPRVMLFLGAVALVLLVACVNVVNLTLAQAVTRVRELAVRAAMGAGRLRLAQQLAFEGTAVAVAAGILGLGIAAAVIRAVVTAAPRRLPGLDTVRLDPAALAVALGLSLLIGIVIGLVPAMRAARRDLFGALHEGGRTMSGGRAANRLRGVFVVTQVALAVVLAVGAGLLVKSFAQLSAVEPGIETTGALTATVGVPGSRYPAEDDRRRFLLDLTDRLRALPGVEAAAVTSQLPLEGYGINFSYWLDGQTLTPDQRPNGDFRVVSPGYFATAGIRVVRGRGFTAQDASSGVPVIVIDESLARREFGSENPVGHRMYVSYTGEDEPREIVGVVADVHQRALDVPASPGYYLPLTQVTWSTMRVLVRTSLPPMTLAESMRRVLADMDPLIPLRGMATLDDLRESSVVVPRFSTQVLFGFAALTLLLAAAGIYSVVSYAVTQRTHEIGVRMALGARAAQVRRAVSRASLTLALGGAAIGLTAAALATPVLRDLLFETGPHDPAAFVVPPMVFLVVAWLGAWVPARRASRVDPMVALRAD